MHRFLSVCRLLSVVTGPKFRMTSISGTVNLRVMKFCHNMDVDDPKVNLVGKGHRSKVKVTRAKKCLKSVSPVSFDHLTGIL